MSCEKHAPNPAQNGSSGVPAAAAAPVPACLSPEEAYEMAKKRGFPDDRTRRAACKDSRYAYAYAAEIDKAPRDDTREAAIKTPKDAYSYAWMVDQAPRDDTRKAACESPEYAYRYAIVVDKAPTMTPGWQPVKTPYLPSSMLAQ